jgi:type II secretory pathway pseudopilin PulG
MMIVVSIIGGLASLAIPQVLRAVNKAKAKHAEADLEMIAAAVRTLASDTGRWPTTDLLKLQNLNTSSNGAAWDLEVYDLGTPLAGLLSAPSYLTNCGWKGPYLHEVPLDPWGVNYVFDPDYRVWFGREVGKLNTTPPYAFGANAEAVVSMGPNKRGGGTNNTYDDDDIYIIVGNVF